MATDSSLYWLIAVPSNAKQPAGAVSGNAKVHKFDVPDCLKVGTLDQLMTLSDDLAKQDSSCGAVVKRFQTGFQELCSNKPTQPGKKRKEDSKKDKKGTMLKISMDDYSGGSSKKTTSFGVRTKVSLDRKIFSAGPRGQFAKHY